MQKEAQKKAKEDKAKLEKAEKEHIAKGRKAMCFQGGSDVVFLAVAIGTDPWSLLVLGHHKGSFKFMKTCIYII